MFHDPVKQPKMFHDPVKMPKMFHDPGKQAKMFHDPGNFLRPGGTVKNDRSLIFSKGLGVFRKGYNAQHCLLSM